MFGNDKEIEYLKEEIKRLNSRIYELEKQVKISYYKQVTEVVTSGYIPVAYEFENYRIKDLLVALFKHLGIKPRLQEAIPEEVIFEDDTRA